jgi:outer membrane lipoprotein-sorting protein
LVLAAFALAASSPGVSLADQALVDKALSGLSKRYVGLESFSSDYSRTTTTPAMDNVFRTQANQTANGVLRWKKMSKLRLDQSQPSREALMTDGETVWWHLPAENQVRVYREIDLAGELAPLLSFMSGLDVLTERFIVAEAGREDARKGMTGLVLTDKGATEEAGQIVIYCDRQFALTGFRLSSLTGEKTDFFITDPEINPGFEDSLFVLEIPDGARVIEESF